MAEFCIAEFAAALHLPTPAGRDLVGDALELKHRLPRVWRRVTVSGDLQAWRARRIAQATSHLPVEAVAFVDAQVARFAHRVGPAQTERLIAEAISRFMPEAAEAARVDAADSRHVHIGTTTESFTGTTWVNGEVDFADAIDLDAALAAAAASLAQTGCTASLDVRRAIAFGDLARGENPLDLDRTDQSDESGLAQARPSREVVSHVHLSPASDTVRVDTKGRFLFTKEQVRVWCGPATRVTVGPVIDLRRTCAWTSTRSRTGWLSRWPIVM